MSSPRRQTHEHASKKKPKKCISDDDEQDDAEEDDERKKESDYGALNDKCDRESPTSSESESTDEHEKLGLL